ncbi:hypothetical protein JW868_02060 [Candidatus Woesearchaeota archaeon]|nr:hypothetical protein [Candidatus Woesearchaeota archaeon]
MMHVEQVRQALLHDPNKGIRMIVGAYERGLDQAYTTEEHGNTRCLIEAIAGGPLETIPWAVYNAVGAVYPYLTREQKDNALREILRILDRRNYLEVNGGHGGYGHTPGIREPLLLSDIAVVRPLYWPGLFEEDHLFRDNPTWADWKANVMLENGMFNPRVVNSDFCVAYRLLRNDLRGHPEAYSVEANPAFLERTLHGIVAMRFGPKQRQEDSDQGRERLRELLPESVQDRVERDWADPAMFSW